MSKCQGLLGKKAVKDTCALKHLSIVHIISSTELFKLFILSI